MAINKKLIHFSKGENYDIQKANGNILDSSICFIQDRKTIITHGTEYKAIGWGILDPWKDISNGVYAVSNDGIPVEVANADASCIGIALITDNQRVMIPKANATDGTNITLYWGYNLYEQDVPNLENPADATAAKADYNGKANTAAIISGYTELGKEMNNRDMCKVLETFNEGGYTDWYVPAAGQLYEIYSNRTAINQALTAIGGNSFASNYYWSSSESSSYMAWRVGFRRDEVLYYDKNNNSYVRFVRDLCL